MFCFSTTAAFRKLPHSQVYTCHADGRLACSFLCENDYLMNPMDSVAKWKQSCFESVILRTGCDCRVSSQLKIKLSILDGGIWMDNIHDHKTDTIPGKKYIPSSLFHTGQPGLRQHHRLSSIDLLYICWGEQQPTDQLSKHCQLPRQCIKNHFICTFCMACCTYNLSFSSLLLLLFLFPVTSG